MNQVNRLRSGSFHVRQGLAYRTRRCLSRYESSGACVKADPDGTRNWLFCWTELGTKQVGIIRSLLATCKLQGVKPYEYLVEIVLQRVDQHPAKDVVDLTPCVWKNRFTSRLTLDLDHYVYNGSK